jgi:hypothetical protein
MRIFQTDGALLVDECDAVLSGSYAELCERRQDRVPVWAWMNLLAHGTVEELAVAVHRDHHADRWRQARAYVAGELLDRVGSSAEELLAFQRRNLVPLELELTACRAAEAWRPGELFSALLRALPPAPRR